MYIKYHRFWHLYCQDQSTFNFNFLSSLFLGLYWLLTLFVIISICNHSTGPSLSFSPTRQMTPYGVSFLICIIMHKNWERLIAHSQRKQKLKLMLDEKWRFKTCSPIYLVIYSGIHLHSLGTTSVMRDYRWDFLFNHW